MSCNPCQISAERPHTGAFNLKCLACCTRLVLSTHPDKRQAAVMLAAIERQPGNPGRDQVLAAVRKALSQPALL
jgi:hypothetical protein